MKLKDSIQTATRSLKHAKLRSFLTMLGIVIGIASVILLMSIGSSAQSLIIDQVKGIGSNLITILPGANKGSRFSPPASVLGIVVKTLKDSDINNLRREPSITKVGGVVTGSARAVYENNDLQGTYMGLTGNYFTIINLTFDKGAPFTEDDDQASNHVAVLGPQIAETLFGNQNPLGKNIRLKEMLFRVVGVLSTKGAGLVGATIDNMIMVPASVAQHQLQGIDYYNRVTVKASDAYDIGYVKSRIISILRQGHNITDPNKDDFTIQTQEDALAVLGNVTSVMTLFLTAIAAISLVVGGIGIMNIMFVSVVERTREIGLRKAVGATNKDILEQFLWEAVILTFVGGLVGIFIGAFFTVAVYFGVTRFAGIDWVFSLPISAVLLAVAVSTVIGVVFGIYPAYRASRLNPTEALRYE